jgi:hypothetical protein
MCADVLLIMNQEKGDGSAVIPLYALGRLTGYCTGNKVKKWSYGMALLILSTNGSGFEQCPPMLWCRVTAYQGHGSAL